MVPSFSLAVGLNLFGFVCLVSFDSTCCFASFFILDEDGPARQLRPPLKDTEGYFGGICFFPFRHVFGFMFPSFLDFLHFPAYLLLFILLYSSLLLHFSASLLPCFPASFKFKPSVKRPSKAPLKDPKPILQRTSRNPNSKTNP